MPHHVLAYWPRLLALVGVKRRQWPVVLFQLVWHPLAAWQCVGVVLCLALTVWTVLAHLLHVLAAVLVLPLELSEPLWAVFAPVAPPLVLWRVKTRQKAKSSHGLSLPASAVWHVKLVLRRSVVWAAAQRAVYRALQRHLMDWATQPHKRLDVDLSLQGLYYVWFAVVRCELFWHLRFALLAQDYSAGDALADLSAWLTAGMLSVVVWPFLSPVWALLAVLRKRAFLRVYESVKLCHLRQFVYATLAWPLLGGLLWA